MTTNKLSDSFKEHFPVCIALFEHSISTNHYDRYGFRQDCVTLRLINLASAIFFLIGVLPFTAHIANKILKDRTKSTDKLTLGDGIGLLFVAPLACSILFVRNLVATIIHPALGSSVLN